MSPTQAPVLYIFAGLPASGKTTLSQRLSRQLGAIHLRIDTIEQALRDLCNFAVEGEGYRLAYRIAAENLGLGLSVVADSCNPISLTRQEWEDVAKTQGAKFVNVEIICSDLAEHRSRVDTRKNTIPRLELPTWEQIVQREYDLWDSPRIVIDTAGRSADESFSELWKLLE